MWNIPIPGNIVKTDKLKKFFGTTETVEVGKLYGSIQEGTARKLYQPSMIHPRVHFSTEVIGSAIEWMQTTLKGGKNIPASDQIWYWKEIGTLIALIGMVLLLFPVGQHLQRTEFFKELNETPSQRKSIAGWGWWVGAVITILLPVPLYMKMWDFHGLGILKASYLWLQTITTVLMFRASSVGVISLVLLLPWHFLLNQKTGASFINYGFTWKDKGLEWKKVGKSFFVGSHCRFCGLSHSGIFRLGL